jgi:hypothetical protein
MTKLTFVAELALVGRASKAGSGVKTLVNNLGEVVWLPVAWPGRYHVSSAFSVVGAVGAAARVLVETVASEFTLLTSNANDSLTSYAVSQRKPKLEGSKLLTRDQKILSSLNSIRSESDRAVVARLSFKHGLSIF